METVTFTNATGETITFGGPPYYLQKISGLGDVQADVQTQKTPYTHGERYIDVQLGRREIPINFVIDAGAVDDPYDPYNPDDPWTYLSAERRKVAQIVSPTLGLGVLEYRSGDIVRLIKCIADSVPLYPDGDKRSQRLQVGSLNFIAPRPHWLSRTKQNAAVGVSLFEFPFSGDFEFGRQSDEFFVQNTGDADTPVEITIYGPNVNPIITNVTTGKFIEINIELLEDEVLYINTDIDELRVERTDAEGNVHDEMHRLSFTSSLSTFVLTTSGRRGRNDIAFTADSPIEFTNIELAYTLRYNAV